MLGPQEQASNGGRSESLTMGEPVETWVGKQCGEDLPGSQPLASYDRKGGSCRLFPLLAIGLLLLLLLGMYVLICSTFNWEDSSNCLPEELPMPLIAMLEKQSQPTCLAVV